ncbi:MAG: glycosyltransferase family 4 protein [Geminicoccaceae bacterium]
MPSAPDSAKGTLPEMSLPSTDSPRRVTLVIATLGWGGAQKIITAMANHWARQGWHVTLISMDEENEPPFFPIDGNVDLVALGVKGHTKSVVQAVRQNLRRLIALRKAIVDSDPDAVISFLSATNVRALLATVGLNLPVIVSERGDPNRRSISLSWRCLRAAIYPFASASVAQTDDARDCFHRFIRKRCIVIPNPVVLPESPVARSSKTVIGVGHLVPVKGFDVLVRAFGRIAGDHPDWRLRIWGHGHQRDRLRTTAAELGIEDRLDLPGLTDRPGTWADDASIFVLASRHEGFPNALLEAMAAGLPVIATDCPIGGPRAMIDQGRTGLLVPIEDVAKMAKALDRLMADEVDAARFATAARQRAEDFAMHKIMARWTMLVHETSSSRSDRSVSDDYHRPSEKPT